MSLFGVDILDILPVSVGVRCMIEKLCVCARVFTIQKRGRALQQSEKVGQTSTSEKQQKEEEVGRGDAEEERLRRRRMTEESRNWLANQRKKNNPSLNKIKHKFTLTSKKIVLGDWVLSSTKTIQANLPFGTRKLAFVQISGFLLICLRLILKKQPVDVSIVKSVFGNPRLHHLAAHW